MTGLNQVKEAILSALKEAGLTALGRFGTQAERSYTGPVAVIGVAQAAGKPMGLGGYLGTVYDPDAGTEREIYGRMLEVTVSVDVYAPGGADACESAMETAAETLMAGLPAGLRLRSLQWGQTEWDEDSGLYLRRGTAEYTAQFTATASAETGEILDFELKGVMKEC